VDSHSTYSTFEAIAYSFGPFLLINLVYAIVVLIRERR